MFYIYIFYKYNYVYVMYMCQCLCVCMYVCMYIIYMYWKNKTPPRRACPALKKRYEKRVGPISKKSLEK